MKKYIKTVIIAAILFTIPFLLVFTTYTETCSVKQIDKYEYNRLFETVTADDGKVYGVLARVDSRNYQITRIIWAELDYARGLVNTISEKEYTKQDNLLMPSFISIIHTGKELQSIAYFPGVKGKLGKLERFNVSDTVKSETISADFAGNINNAVISGDDIIVSNVLGEAYRINADGSYEKTNLNDITRNTKNDCEPFHEPQIKKILIALSVGAAVLGIYLLLIFVINKLKINTSLLFKQAIIVVLVMCVGIFFLSDKIETLFIEAQHDALVFSIRKTIHKTINSLDLERLAGIDWDNPENLSECKDYQQVWERVSYGIDYTNLTQITSQVNTRKLDTLEENFYIALLYPRDNEWRVGVYDFEFVGTSVSSIFDDNTAELYNSLLIRSETDGLVMGFNNDDEYLGMIIPVYDKDDNPIALIECGLLKLQYEYDIQQKVDRITRWLLVVTGIVVLIMMLGLGLSVRSLKHLKNAVESVGRGDYSFSLPVSGHDEIARISESFNAMSNQIDKYTQGLMELNNAYFRFLPLEILEKLGKESVISVKEGDSRLVDTYIMKVTVTDFIKATEKMNSENVFALFNEISGTIMRIVSENNGFITNAESGSQIGFISFFENESDALSASYSVRREFSSVALKNSYTETAIAIVRGEVLIGVAGHKKRLCTFSISESVKLAECLTKISENYGAGVVFATSRPKTNMRYLGSIHFGENDKTNIYECYEGESEDVFFGKSRTRELFEKGVCLFEEKKFKEAKSVFIEYLKHSVPDAAARKYLFLCENNLKNPWNIKVFGD